MIDPSSFTEKVLTGVISALALASTWLVRTILTNNRKITILETRLEGNMQRYENIMESIEKLRGEIHELDIRQRQK